MRKRRRWHRINSIARRVIISVITAFSICMLFASVETLIEHTAKALVVFMVSLAWIVLFCRANA